jgi:hypothetical protein
MVCEWFTWNSDCDLPNWFALLTEGIIGAGITTYFFAHQRNEKKRKKRLALQRIADAYDMVDDQINVLKIYENEIKENISTDPKNHDYQINIEQSIKGRKNTIENLQGYTSNLNDALDLFSDDLDQGMKAITKFLIDKIGNLEVPLDDKPSPIIFLDDVIEVNKRYNEILTSIKPNPRKDFKKSLEAMSEYTTKGGGLPWTNHMDHLYYGKLDKKDK